MSAAYEPQQVTLTCPATEAPHMLDQYAAWLNQLQPGPHTLAATILSQDTPLHLTRPADGWATT